MKACVVLFLLLPIQAVVETVSDTARHLRGLYSASKIPDSYSVNPVQEVCCG